MISVKQVSKYYDNRCVVNNVSFDVEDGETLVLLGSSGCGKTTLLKMINRLIDASAGEITIDDKNIAEQDPVMLRRSIGYVIQSIGLFPHMTVEDNIAIVLRLEGKTQQQQSARAHELLETINLNPTTFAKLYPHQLSGGQRQRVGVARALANNPAYLLMDEPFGALDAINRAALQDEMAELRNRLQKTIIFVTHDIFEALRLGDHIAVMNQGKIEQLGTGRELIKNPASDFVKNLFDQVSKQVHLFKDYIG